MSESFEHHISVEAAYRLICLHNADEGGRDAISARGWLKYSSWHYERMYLADGSFIIREPYVDGHCIHINESFRDIIDMFWDDDDTGLFAAPFARHLSK